MNFREDFYFNDMKKNNKRDIILIQVIISDLIS